MNSELHYYREMHDMEIGFQAITLVHWSNQVRTCTLKIIKVTREVKKARGQAKGATQFYQIYENRRQAAIATCTFARDVNEHSRHEGSGCFPSYLRWFERVICWKMDREEEDTTLKRAVRLSRKETKVRRIYRRGRNLMSMNANTRYVQEERKNVQKNSFVLPYRSHDGCLPMEYYSEKHTKRKFNEGKDGGREWRQITVNSQRKSSQKSVLGNVSCARNDCRGPKFS